MKRIYVCSPLGGEKMNYNIMMAKTYSMFVAEQGHIPMTPHIYYTQFMDDNNPAHRQIGLDEGIEWLKRCDELWVFGNNISTGMANEIRLAPTFGIPVRFFTDGGRPVECEIPKAIEL